MGKCLQSSKANASMLGNLKISLRIFAKFLKTALSTKSLKIMITIIALITF